MVFKHLRRGSKGFTLIELMIVIAIIGILAAIAIPNFMSARDRARRSGAKQTLGSLRKAMEMYMVDNDSYPGSMGTTQTSIVTYLGGYTNITSLLTGLRGAALTSTAYSPVSPPVTYYTLVATALDRASTSCTANVDNVWSYPD